MSTDQLDTDPGSPIENLSESSRQSRTPETKVKVDFGAVTHAGKVRKNNEDHFLVVRLGRSLEPLMTNMPAGQFPDRITEFGYGMVVADGMGGAAAGEVASRTATNLLIKLVMDAARWYRRIDEEDAEALLERLDGYYRAIHTELVKQGETNPAIEGMGTTLTITYSFGPNLFVAHAGDSRAYLFREGKLRQLTHDHTVAQRLADQGEIPQEAVANHRLRHILTNVLGGHEGPIVTELEQIKLMDGDRLLVCSDGLTDMVGDSDIADILGDIDDPQKACDKLLALALDAGGKDNVTITMARYGIPKEQSPVAGRQSPAAE